MESLSSELQGVEQQIQEYSGMDFGGVRATVADCCSTCGNEQGVPKTSRLCDLRADKGCQTDIKMEEPVPRAPDPCSASVSSKEKSATIIDTPPPITTVGARNKTITHLQTSYTVDRMASDGRNILYTSYNDHEPHVIAYCLIDNRQNAGDEKQAWNSQRVEDMGWWKKIQKFVCGTQNEIYTVDRMRRNFKIVSVLRGDWSRIRVATNDDHIFLHSAISSIPTKQANGIYIYSADFLPIRVISIADHKQLLLAESLCVTNQTLAAIRMNTLTSFRAGTQNLCQVIILNFFNLDGEQIRGVCLGKCSDSIQVRTDGTGNFFVSTGETRLHIVTADRKYRTFDLKHDGDCIAVLDNQRIAVSKGRANIELVTY